jgi:hypothetical protein
VSAGTERPAEHNPSGPVGIPPLVLAEPASDYLARLIRERAEAAFDAINSRADLQRCARLYCLAIYLEQETETGLLFRG